MNIQDKKTRFLERLAQVGVEKVELPNQFFRINSLKSPDAQIVLKSLHSQGFEFVAQGFPDAYQITKSAQPLSQTEEFKFGQIYIQSLSSMLPPLVLDPKPQEKILDLCAAPGSKTSLLAELSNNQAQITAVENNYSRFVALKNNLETQNVKNVDFIKASGASLPMIRPDLLGYFDKVMLDAPCSNEGLISVDDEKALNMWNPKTAKHLSSLQKKLMGAALHMLNKGGTLVYSTCTYSLAENEEVIDWALKKFPDLRVDSLDYLAEKLPATRKGIVEKKLNPQVANSLRLLPRSGFSGFYICRLQRLVDGI